MTGSQRPGGKRARGIRYTLLESRAGSGDLGLPGSQVMAPVAVDGAPLPNEKGALPEPALFWEYI